MQLFYDYHTLNNITKIDNDKALAIMKFDLYHLDYIHFLYPQFCNFNDKIYYLLHTLDEQYFIIKNNFNLFNSKIIDYYFVIPINNIEYLIFKGWEHFDDYFFCLQLINNDKVLINEEINIKNNITYFLISKISKELNINKKQCSNYMNNVIVKIQSILYLLEM